MNSSESEMKACPRCQCKFTCSPTNITQCQCHALKLTSGQSEKIAELYDDCLCVKCLTELQQQFMNAG